MSCPLAVYDFTLSVAKSTEDHNMIIDELNQIAKKWVFQKERPQEYDAEGNIIYPGDDISDDDYNTDNDNNDDSTYSESE